MGNVITGEQRGDSTDTVPAVVEDLAKLKGQYLRNIRTDILVKVIDVGKLGVTARYVEGNAYGAPPVGEPHAITWRAVKAVYNIMVNAHEIEGVKE